jgi:hypothetical protein
LPEVHLDFCFIGDEREPGEALTVLIVKERTTKMAMATVVPSKSTGRFVSERVVAWMAEVGIDKGDVVMKSDQENAIKCVVEAIATLRAANGGGRCMLENSPKGSSQSNGVIERYAQTIERQVVVMKCALEMRWKVKIGSKHPVLTWMVEYAAHLICRFEVSHDGKTAYERCKGKRAKTKGVEFGEAILWRRKPVGNALGKLTSMWEHGVFLGVKGKSGEMIVGDSKGVWKTRTIHRKPFEERWAEKLSEMVVGVPWNTSDEDMKADGPKMQEVMVMPWRGADESASGIEREGVPRRLRIVKEDLYAYGFSQNCPGCKAVLQKTGRWRGTTQNHAEGGSRTR